MAVRFGREVSIIDGTVGVAGRRASARRRKTQRIRIGSTTSMPIVATVTAAAMWLDEVELWRIFAFALPLLLTSAMAGAAAWSRRGLRVELGPHPLDRPSRWPMVWSVAALPFLLGGPAIPIERVDALAAALMGVTCFLTITGMQYRRHLVRYRQLLLGLGALYAGVFIAGGRFGIAALVIAWTANMVFVLTQAVRTRTELAEVSDEHLAMARLDGLTGALNREGLLDAWISSRSAAPQTLLMFDLDGFRAANEHYGYGFGDEVLVETSRRLIRSFADIGQVARLGGDQFAVLVNGSVDDEPVRQAIARARESLTSPHTSYPNATRFDVSIGSVEFNVHADLEEALSNADYAMAVAKERPEDDMVRFEVDMRDSLAARMQRDNALRQALAGRRFEWWGQPILAADTLEPVAVEMLCRRRTDQGFETPDQFLEQLDAMGLLPELGRQNLRSAAEWLRLWGRDAELGGIAVNVNLTATHLADSALDELSSISERDLGRLNLELLEKEALPQTARLAGSFASLQEGGVRLVLDDFGAGYSALSLFAELPIDEVKIDRSIIDGVEYDATKSALVEAVTSLAGNLGMTTVAEGIETRAQLDAVRRLGVDHVQGWLWGQALPLGELTFELRRLRREARTEPAAETGTGPGRVLRPIRG